MYHNYQQYIFYHIVTIKSIYCTIILKYATYCDIINLYVRMFFIAGLKLFVDSVEAEQFTTEKKNVAFIRKAELKVVCLIDR